MKDKFSMSNQIFLATQVNDELQKLDENIITQFLDNKLSLEERQNLLSILAKHPTLLHELNQAYHNIHLSTENNSLAALILNRVYKFFSSANFKVGTVCTVSFFILGIGYLVFFTQQDELIPRSSPPKAITDDSKRDSPLNDLKFSHYSVKRLMDACLSNYELSDIEKKDLSEQLTELGEIKVPKGTTLSQTELCQLAPHALKNLEDKIDAVKDNNSNN